MNSSYFNTAAGAFLGVVFVVMTLSIVSDGIFETEAPETEGFAIEVAGASKGGDSAPAAEAKAESVMPLLASADPAKGEAVFKKCAACHTNDASGGNKIGPGLWNIVNRPVASHEGFKYSAAMTEFSQGGAVNWDYEHLDGFLTAPKKYVPGTAMGFAGVKKIEDRADLIAYLRTLGDAPAPLPAVTAAPAASDAGTAAPANADTAAPAGAEPVAPAN